MEEVAINPTRTARTYRGLENTRLEGTTEPCAPGLRRKEQRPHRRLACGYPEISGEGVGHWWPAAGLGARTVAAHAWDLLREVTIIFTTPTTVSVQSFSRVQLFATPWTAAHQASLSVTNSQSLPKLMSIESVMLYNHLILCHPLLLLPSIFPSIRVFSNKSALCTRWPKYWSFRFNISPSNEHSGLISFRMDWLDLLEVQGTLKRLLQHHSSKTSILLQ